MRKLSVLLIICLGFTTSFLGQNLVPNFSFEEYIDCPDAEDQIEYATGWSKYSENITTPDYFNSCAISGNYSVPNGIGFVQNDHRNCSAIAGLVIFDQNGYREHIGIELTESLIIGQTYYLSFNTVMGELKIGNNYFGMPSNNIGLKLSTINYHNNNPAPIDNSAHLYSSNIVDDSINWHRVSGSLIADSNYNYLIVGNFFDNSNTDTLHYECPSCINFGSYYLIDDICISTDSLFCNQGIDLLSCHASIPNFENESLVEIYPNPVFQKIFLKNLNDQYNYEIFDIAGLLLLKGKVINSEIDFLNFDSKFYILKLINQSTSEILIRRIIKI